MPNKVDTRAHVVIVGAGFAGLAAARSLAKAPVRITLVDRRNHHLFQPLLYQVATAGLNPGDIAEPIRNIVASQENVRVMMAAVEDIDTDNNVLHLEAQRQLSFDYLLVATGVTHAYFGNDHWAALAPGLKTLEDAVSIRRKFLLAFEHAELTDDLDERNELLTFLIVGGGPTGVELAGAMAEMAYESLADEFHEIDCRKDVQIILLEGGDRLLAAYPQELSVSAKKQLENLGVEVRLGAFVTEIDEHGVVWGGQRIAARNVFWAAGVAASHLGSRLGAETDQSGRVVVEQDLTIDGHKNIFVCGDLAHCIDASGREVPGVAQGAIQMGEYAARAIITRLEGSDVGPFVYYDKGNLATIGRNAAVAEINDMKFSGFPAWFIWAVIHVLFLIGFDNKLVVMIQWTWSYFAWKRGARLITQSYANE